MQLTQHLAHKQVMAKRRTALTRPVNGGTHSLELAYTARTLPTLQVGMSITLDEQLRTDDFNLFHAVVGY